MKSTLRATSLAKEFRAFALKGNVVDLAIAVIIGGAFSKIVDSLVKHIIMPVVSLFFPSEQSYLGWKFVVGSKEVPYGLFIGEVLNFLIVALALFVFAVKFLGWLSRRGTAAEAAAPAKIVLTKDQELLTEIKNILQTRKT